MTELKSSGTILLVALLGWMPLPAADSGADEEATEVHSEASGVTEYVEVNVSYVPKSNTIATKLPIPLQLTPANIGVVSGPLFREQSAEILGDALRNVSGLNVQTQSGITDYFLIRGFDSLSSGLVLTDGASEPEATLYQLYNVEGIEVLKGPAGFLYGGNPLAGAVNLVRKQPAPTDFTLFNGSIGSHATYQGSVDWNLGSESGNGNFRLNSLWRESDHYRDDKDSSLFAVNPSFALRTGERSTLNFNLEYVDAEYSPDSGLPLFDGEIVDVPRRRSYQTPFDFSKQEIQRFQVDYEFAVREGLTLRNKTYYRDLDWQSNGTLFAQVFPTPGGSLAAARVLTLLDSKQQFFGNQFEAILTLSSGRVQHRILFGLEAARLVDDFAIEFVPPEDPLNMIPGVPAIDLFDPVETFAGIPFTVPQSAGEVTSEVIAPYVIDQMQLSDRFQLLLGARYDHIDFEDDLQPIKNRSDGEISPMAGLVFAPNPSLSLFANSGQSFAPAGARVDLSDPEESTQVEVGVRKRFMNGNLRTTFAVYEIDRENIAISDDNGVTQQSGDQRSRGFEFELAAEPRSGLRTFFSYAYNDSELTEFQERIDFPPFGPADFLVVDHTGNTPSFAPENLANLWISKTFGNGLGLGGGARFVDGQFIDEDNAFEIDSYLTLDGTIFYDFDNSRVKLNLRNLTDEDYEMRGFESGSVIPADPFTVSLEFEFRM